jgi:hypothetical protein
LTVAALTALATGSSIVTARTARNAADVIFFMVVDPSRIATLIVQSFSEMWVAR